MSEKTEGYTLRDERNAFMQERDELLAELHRLDQRLCKASGHWLSRDKMIDALASERDEAVRVAGELRAALASCDSKLSLLWYRYKSRIDWEDWLGVSDSEMDFFMGNLRRLTERGVPHPFVETDVMDRGVRAHYPMRCQACGKHRSDPSHPLDSLTASTGGSSDEPQKEIRE